MIILKALTEIFIWTEILSKDHYTSQFSSQYLSQILVPETTIRLIAKDYTNISLDIAKEIMIDSIEFELYVHDDHDA